MRRFSGFKAPYDDNTLKAIDRMNFENWMMENRRIVALLYLDERLPTELHKTFHNIGKSSLTKTLRRGIEFGALRQERRHHPYYLTEKARKFYEEITEQTERT